MKVTYLHQYFGTPAMEGGTRSYELAKRLVAAGHQVNMITSDCQRSGPPYRTLESGIDVTWIPVPYSNGMGDLARIRAFVRFAAQSSRIAAQHDADVVFATSTPLTIAIPAIYTKWRRNVPMVFEVRDLWPEMPIAMGVLRDPLSKFLARLLERLAYRHADRIVALSPGIEQGVISQGYAQDLVTLIPNACDFDLFAGNEHRGQAFRDAHPWLGNRPLVVYAGTLGRVNDVSYLAKLAKAVQSRNPEIRFLTVGSGQERDKVRSIATELGVLNVNLFMFDGVEKARVPEILAAATFATSLFADVKEMWNNSANKFFDALAAGKPVAINYGGWQADLLNQNRAGLVLDAQDTDAAADMLVSAIANLDWLAAAGRSAGRMGRAFFDRDLLAHRLIGVLNDAVCPEAEEPTRAHAEHPPAPM